MIEQMQCEKCGSDNIAEKKMIVHRESRKEVFLTNTFVLILLGGFLLFCGLLPLASIVTALFQSGNDPVPWYGLLYVVVSLGMAGALFWDYKRADKVELYKYTCRDCHHQWGNEQWDGPSGMIPIDIQSDVQCEFCHENYVMTQTIVINQKTGKPINWLINVVGGWLLVVLGAGFLIITIWNWGTATIQFLAMSAILLSSGFQWIGTYNSGQKVIKHKCSKCGHEWSESQDGSPIEKKAEQSNSPAVSTANDGESQKAAPSLQNVLKIAKTHADRGHWIEAVKAYQRALSLSPDNANIFNNLGIAHEELGNFEDAEQAYKQAITLDPGNQIYYCDLADFYEDQERTTEAVKTCKKGLQQIMDKGDRDEIKKRLENIQSRI